MLEIRDLVKVYPGPVTALGGISLEIDRGMFGLLGPNGAGKTTLMRILAGLLEPTSGHVLLGDVDVTADRTHLRSRLGYLPQYFGFYPNLTGRAMLIHMLRLKGVEAPAGTEHLAEQLLERVNLSDAATRKVSEYSGGMRQRLGIAQAVAGDPDLVIVDEPTAGLDPEERLRFYRLLAELAAERIVLLSTHIVEDVSMLCPQFAVIRAGVLLAKTTPTDARRHLDGRVFEGRVDGLAADHVTVIRSHLVEGRELLRIHVASGPPPPGFQPVEATLEDAYLLMMNKAEARRDGAAAREAS